MLQAGGGGRPPSPLFPPSLPNIKTRTGVLPAYPESAHLPPSIGQTTTSRFLGYTGGLPAKSPRSNLGLFPSLLPPCKRTGFSKSKSDCTSALWVLLALGIKATGFQGPLLETPGVSTRGPRTSTQHRARQTVPVECVRCTDIPT